MSDTIIVAVISLVGTAFGSFIGLLINNKLVSYKLDELTKRVEKHNNFAVRIPVLEEQIKTLNHIIDNDRL